MHRLIVLIIIIFFCSNLEAQLVEVENNIISGGDVVFGATNFSKTPVFIKVEFTELQNTIDDDIRIYYRKLAPGYNNIFNLTRRVGAGVPYFYYKIKAYRSDPVAKVDLKFPYLIPLAPGKTAKIFDVKDIAGFWGDVIPKSWFATGFVAQPGDAVYAARTGEVVEIVENTRTDNPELWYNTWTNIITLLQPDGTLISYKNVIDREKKLKLNQKIFAGQILGEVVPGTNEIVVVIYHNSGINDELLFVVPQFVTAPDKVEMINSSMRIDVVHPIEIRGLEMSKKEQRKILKN